MNVDDPARARLQFLVRVVQRECRHLVATDRRVFDGPFSREQAAKLDNDIELAERVEAFVSRFGRLQDTLGSKLIPELLRVLGEPIGAMIDNLDRAERFGWVSSTEAWLSARQLRNQMVHEYIEDLTVLASALQAGHENVPMLIDASQALCGEIDKRGLLGDDAPA